MEEFGKFVAGIIATLIAVIVNGLVIVKLWEWFIVATFDTIQITIPQALGLTLLGGLILGTKKQEGSFIEQILGSIFSCLFMLLFGYILTLFM